MEVRRYETSLTALGEPFAEPDRVALLTSPMLVAVAKLGLTTRYIAVWPGIGLDTLQTHEVLATIKTNPYFPQDTEAALADWIEPFYEKAHAALGKNNEWATVMHLLKPFIQTYQEPSVDDRVNDEAGTYTWNSVRYSLRNGSFLRMPQVRNGFLGESMSGADRVFDALQAFASGEAGKALHPILDRLLAAPAYDYRSEGQSPSFNDYIDLAGKRIKVGQLCCFVGHIWNSPKSQEPNHIFGQAFLESLGDTSIAQYWGFLQIYHGQTGNNINTKHVNFSRHADEITVHPNHGDAFTLRLDEDSEPQAMIQTKPIPLHLTPVLAWEKVAGRRSWLANISDDEVRQLFPEVVSENGLLSPLLGLLCLAYVCERQRKRLPHALPFTKGGKVQEMLEAQIPYLVMLRIKGILRRLVFVENP